MKKLLAAFADAVVDVSETMAEASAPAPTKGRFLDRSRLADTPRELLERLRLARR